MVGSEKLFSTTYYRHLFNLTISKEIVTTSFANTNTYILSLHCFLFKTTNINHLKDSTKFDKYNIALFSIATRIYLLNPQINNDIHDLAIYTKTYVLLLVTSTQYIKSTIKDISLCEISGRSELTVTYIHNVQS